MTSLNDNSPVFCTADVPADLLTKFFEEAYSPSELVDELGTDNVDIGVLINTEDMSAITKPTLPPVSDQSSWPFKDKTAEEIWGFAKQNIKYPPTYNRAVAILDDQTIKDKETCVLVTRRSLPKEDQSELIIVRSDFKSALMILNMRNLAIAGDEHFERTDSDGVIRYSQAGTTGRRFGNATWGMDLCGFGFRIPTVMFWRGLGDRETICFENTETGHQTWKDPRLPPTADGEWEQDGDNPMDSYDPFDMVYF